jgi:hypothetical protein
MIWLNFVSFGIGMWIGSSLNDLRRLYHTFQKQNCVNTILPLKLEPYIPQKVINIIEMCKFLVEYKLTQLSQYTNQTCIRKGNRYHLRCVIDHKLYNIVLKPKRGPEIDYVWLDEKNIDRSEYVKSYIRGAESVFKDIYPNTFGYKKLCKNIGDQTLCTFYTEESLIP